MLGLSKIQWREVIKVCDLEILESAFANEDIAIIGVSLNIADSDDLGLF